MRFTRLGFAIIFATAVFAAGCGNGETPANNSTTKTANKNAAPANDPLAISTPAPVAATNDAPTLSPVVKAYCAARVKKDDAALRKIYSAETLRDFEARMKESGEKTISEYLSVEEVTLDICDAQNERIEGDRAIATVMLKWAPPPNGIDLVFVKENGEWKLTNEAPALKKPQK